MAVGVARCRPPVHAFASAEDPPGDLRVPVPAQLVVLGAGQRALYDRASVARAVALWRRSRRSRGKLVPGQRVRPEREQR